MIFRGTFEHALDAKKRLTVPARFRETFSDGVVLAVSPEIEPGLPRSIAMWTPGAYETYTETVLQGLNPLSPRAREMSQVLFGNSHDVELDSANRVMIPAQLMTYAGLDREVMVTGVGPNLEIWDRATYTAYNERALSRFSKIAASFDHTA